MDTKYVASSSVKLLRLRKLWHLLSLASCATCVGAVSAMSEVSAARAELFVGPNADFSTPLTSSTDSRDQDVSHLRTLHVEERAGVDRKGELVRVPLFFAAGECSSIEELEIVAATAGATAVPFQADDIRRGPNGGVSRLHLYFAADLAAGEKRQFRLNRKRRDVAPAAAEEETVRRIEKDVTISTTNGSIVVTKDGGIRSVNSEGARWDFESPAAPRIVLSHPSSESGEARETMFDRDFAERRVEYANGPLFSRVRVTLTASDGVSVEQDLRIPRHGREVILTTAIFPGRGPEGRVKENQLLHASLRADAGRPSVLAVPAGIRSALRSEHAYSVSALIAPKRDAALLAIPTVIGGSSGIWATGKDGSVTLQGFGGLQKGNEGEKRTLLAYWNEVRLVPVKSSDPEQLWKRYRERVQPLVAIVEEPAATVEYLHEALRDLVEEMKPIGWRQEAGRLQVLGEKDRVSRTLQRVQPAKEGSVEDLMAGARNAHAKLTNNGARKLREDEKGRAYGGLDPYHITYSQSAAAALAVLYAPPPAVQEVNLAMAQAVREAGGRVDDAGYPYIDCFNRTLNMQLGPVLFGLTAGQASNRGDLVRFYRDLAASPLVKGVFGRAQRPYTGGPTKRPEQTDYLYQSICDFWLRATELLGNENLELHPLVYSRFTDCIDVMADRYHTIAARAKEDTTGEVRANFFRGQTHTHRWLGWSCSPYIRLLEDPAEQGTVGLTEAVRYSRAMKGRWKNWPDLTFYILADLLVRDGLNRYARPVLPASPTGLSVKRSEKRAELTWQPVADAAGYRVYRADSTEGSHRWLNSPHVASALAPLVTTRFIDDAATATAKYVVTAVDAAGRESAWSDAVAAR